MRVYNIICRWKDFKLRPVFFFKWNNMVISYNNCKSSILCVFDCIISRYSIVASDNRITTCLNRFINKLHIETVTISNTMWYRIVDICSEVTKARHKDISRHNSIDIIVSDYSNLLSFIYEIFYQISGFLCVTKEIWVLKHFARRA